MAQQFARDGQRSTWAQARGLAGLTVCLMLGACADTGSLLPDAKTQLADDAPPPAATESAAGTKSTPQSELQRATVYWGQEFSKNPNDLKSALSYARNLKAMGERQKALSVLQQASVLHSADPELAGEYGRLALDLDQVSLAAKLLEVADNPTKPDWKVISARGTVLAKQGQYKDAIPYYERALTLQQNHPSLLNNLAMAYAMSGEPKKAEEILRQASADAGGSPKVRQNLALVLGLQGKYDEAKALSAKDMPMESAASNANYMKSMVKLDPKSAPPAAPKPFATTVAKAIDAAKPVAPAAASVASSNEVSELKPAAIDTSSAQDTWKTNVASTQPDQATTTSGGLRGSAR